MLRTLLMFRSPPRLLLAAAALLPALAHPASSAPTVVAEATFLCDPLPPGGRDLGLGVIVEPAGAAVSHFQVAFALGRRVGLTADVAVDPTRSSRIGAPGASLKLLLRDPDGGALGVGASLDLLGARALAETESALGLGVIRALGHVTLRAGASLASPLGRWGPHLHGGASAAVEVGPRWRFLGELVAEARAGELELAAGPTVKIALDGKTSLAAGALLPLSAPLAPSLVVQLTRGL